MNLNPTPTPNNSITGTISLLLGTPAVSFIIWWILALTLIALTTHLVRETIKLLWPEWKGIELTEEGEDLRDGWILFLTSWLPEQWKKRR